MKTPWWFTALLIIAALPMILLTTTASRILGDFYDSDTAVIGWFYPVYILAAGVCSWLSWPSRRATAWILLAIMFLTDILLCLCL